MNLDEILTERSSAGAILMTTRTASGETILAEMAALADFVAGRNLLTEVRAALPAQEAKVAQLTAALQATQDALDVADDELRRARAAVELERGKPGQRAAEEVVFTAERKRADAHAARMVDHNRQRDGAALLKTLTDLVARLEATPRPEAPLFTGILAALK